MGHFPNQVGHFPNQMRHFQFLNTPKCVQFEMESFLFGVESVRLGLENVRCGLESVLVGLESVLIKVEMVSWWRFWRAAGRLTPEKKSKIQEIYAHVCNLHPNSKG
jgi:hypothetical protein